MNDGTVLLPWFVIRQDDNGNRYRVGRYATKAEAQRIADRLDDRGHKQLYSVEKLSANGSGR
ncbi:SPOR domain-containing protein [Streptomyces sp. NPDC018029]|uniref:SPOR domain-containing protein n=1 Tax=Streptomyces sp. NPDC018029 TaxID=3365032 RepID=UPI0037AA65E4